MKNRYSDPDPLWTRIQIEIHFFQMWIRGSGSAITERWIRGSGSTFPKCRSQDSDPDPRQNEMDPKRCLKQTEVSSSVDSLFSLCVSTDIELQFYVEMRMKRFPPAPESGK